VKALIEANRQKEAALEVERQAQIVYKGQTIDLDTKYSLGSGGEAIVIKHKQIAFKIYHSPSPERAIKLQDFLRHGFKLSNHILAPVDLTRDSKGNVNGFAMEVAPKAASFIDLSNLMYRKKHQISTNNVAEIFFNSKAILDVLHNNNPEIVVGDLNDVNKLFTDDWQVYYIDVDSFQFGKHPCFVGTDTFIDPRLYGVDLTKKPAFTKETDHYAFAVMLFKSLLFVHPYGGMHGQYKTMVRRAEKAVWALDKSVIYPKIGLHPETLSDDVLDYFAKMFVKGQRLGISAQTLQSLIGSFIECKSCGTFYSNTRSKCPQCQKTAPQRSVDLTNIIVQKQVDTERCDVTLIYQTTGTILFMKVVNNKIVVVSFENGNTVLSVIAENYKQSFVLWAGFEKQFKYEYFEPSHLVVNQGNDLIVFDISKNMPLLIMRCTTLSYKNDPVFSCSQDYLYRLTTNAIMRGKFVGDQFIEEDITTAMENQTWLSTGQNDFGLGMFQVFSQSQFFVFSKTGRYEVEMDQIKGQVIDMSVCVSVSNLILLRKTIVNGRTFSHWHIINSEGKVLESKTEESLNSELLKNIHGKQLAGSSIVHATDAGIVIEKHGQLALKQSTAEFVDSDQSLWFYRQGLLAVSANKISYLVLQSY